MPDLNHEQAAWSAGHFFVAGVDEAGRGPLAGPVVAAAVILPKDFSHPWLNDSKKLSARRRDLIFRDLTTAPGLRFAIAEASVEEIERFNILRATHLAMHRAVAALDPTPSISLIDGLRATHFPLPQIPIIKGDSASLSIAAASILAKVTRDKQMIAAANDYPEYGFDRHKGYGTRAHLEALTRHGPCPIHRKTFQPIAQLQISPRKMERKNALDEGNR